METVTMWTPWGDPAPESYAGATPFVEPAIIEATPSEQVFQMVSDLQDEGLVGLVERTEILRRYPEYCWMHGWMPMSENHLFEALAKITPRKRPFYRGQRVTCYEIPKRPLAAQVANRAKLLDVLAVKPQSGGRMKRAA